MAPKRPSKRRGEDEDGRPAKKGGKGRKEPTYDTYDECLDGGVEMEEKGERYRDGDKALRFYERALELYTKAFEMQNTYDTAYNRARVHYTIGTSFHLPPRALEHLEQSINHYRTASGLTNSPLLLLDSTYNRAQSLIALADILDDTEPASPEPKAQALRAEASTILSEVLDGQEAFLSRQAEQGDDAIEEVEAGADETSMEVDEDGDEDQDGEEETFETYLPTPSTFIDTALALVDLSLSTWESIEPLQPPTEQAQAFVRNVLDRATRLCPSERQPELDLTEIKVLMSVDGIVWDMYRSEAKVGSGIESSLEGATLVLTKLLASLDQPSSETGETTTPTAESNLVRAEILTTLAETHMTIADRLTFLLPQLPTGPSHLAQQAWYHYSQTVTDLNKALELPTSASTPREFKPSVFLNLSKASLERARLGRVNETAKRNATQLMENAWTYAAKAAEGLRWNSLALGSNTPGPVQLPAPGGWDTESLGREVILQSLRVCYTSTSLVDEASRSKFSAGVDSVLGRIKQLPVDRRIQNKDISDFIDDLTDEGKLDAGEKEWWYSIVTQLGITP